MKSKVQRRIYKINSKRFRLNKWELNLDKTNTLPEEVVKLGDNQIFESIRQLKGISLEEQEKTISILKKNIKSKKDVQKSVSMLNKEIFMDELIFVTIDRESDYHKLNLKTVLNGIEYKRLYATTGGVKNSTIIYIKKELHDEIQRIIDNDRDMSKEFSAGKLEAYKSLTFTNSTKVSMPRKLVIVKDYIQKFVEKEIIELDDSQSKYPRIEFKKDEEVEVNVSDGFMVISMWYAELISKELGLDYIPSGFLFRNSFLKGMGYPMQIEKFANEVIGTKFITDIYGNAHDVEGIDMIIPESVFKLWSSYGDSEDYINSCIKNGYSFRVAKVTPKVLDNRRNLNYQFIQTMNLSDNDIKELCNYTVNSIKDIINNDYTKTILFTKGISLNDFNYYLGAPDFSKALMIEPRIIDDPFVKSKVHSMLKKKINDAKIGVISVEGNFQTISGDIYQFLQHAFGVENPTGLLKSNEIYSKYWSDLGVSEVALFRAPMSSHNNIRKVKVVNSDEINKWYGHLNTVMLISSFDTITHALNGADKDGDAFFSTNNKIILKNIKELPCVICKQKTAPKKICTFDDFVTANINGFGDEIGSITNKITEMICKQSNFGIESDEYKELEYRILCGQLYQQNAIDKIKSIQANPMPKEWYDFKSNVLERDEDGNITKLDDFNISILADKKPYFFIYNYPTLKKEYNDYMKNVNIKSINLFGMTLDELQSYPEKSNDIEKFLEDFIFNMPVDMSDCTMNKLCKHIEKELDCVKFDSNNIFDKSILKTDANYSKSNFNKVKDIYEEYKKETSRFSIRNKYLSSSDDLTIDRDYFKNEFISKLSEIKITEEELANIVIDLCYDSNNSKQFAWDVAGEQILKNILLNNNNRVRFPVLDRDGDIEFNGLKFSMKELEVTDVVENCN